MSAVALVGAGIGTMATLNAPAKVEGGPDYPGFDRHDIHNLGGWALTGGMVSALAGLGTATPALLGVGALLAGGAAGVALGASIEAIRS